MQADELALPGSAVHFLDGEQGAVWIAPCTALEMLRLLNSQVTQQAAVPIDGQSVQVMRPDELARFVSPAQLCGSLSIVETGEEVLPKSPGQQRLDRWLGQSVCRQHHHANPATLWLRRERRRTFAQRPKIVCDRVENLVCQRFLLAVVNGRQRA